MSTSTLSARITAILGPLAKKFRFIEVVNGVELQVNSYYPQEDMWAAKRALEAKGISAFPAGHSLFTQEIAS